MAEKGKAKGTTTQLQVVYMLGMLSTWKQQLGGGSTRKALASSQFDYLQQQFLQKRIKIQKLMDQLDKAGGQVTKQTATYRHQVRQGIKQMKVLVGRLEQEYKKKRKKEDQQIGNKKLKIVQNCKLLLQDVQDRQGQVNGNNYQAKKVMTFTDMKEKLLNQIDQNANFIHNQGSDGKLSQVNQDEINAMQRWKKKDEQIDQLADQAANNVKQLRYKVQGINKKQDQVNQKVKKGAKQIDKLNTRIQKDNQKIKKVIKAFKPTRCCLVVVMFLLLIGLIVVVLRMVLS